MIEAAETRQRQDVLLELFEMGVLDQQELDAELTRLPKPEEQHAPSPSSQPGLVPDHVLAGDGFG